MGWLHHVPAEDKPRRSLVAGDIMTKPVVTIGPDTKVLEIAALLLQRHISGVPVVDRGRVVGIVSEGDLLRRHEIGTAGTRRRSWLGFLRRDGDAVDYVKSHAIRAADIMSRDVVGVGEATPIGDIAALFASRRIRRAPVLEGGRAVGIVSRADIVRALAYARAVRRFAYPASDRRIRENLLGELRGHDWWHAVSNVVVTDGVVHLWGLYETDEGRRAARVAAENVPGVRRIEDHRVRDTYLPTMV